MLFFILSLMILFSSLITIYYTNSISGYQKEIQILEDDNKVLECIKENYIKDYTEIHKNNLNNINTNYRLENMYMKIKRGHTKIYTPNILDGLELSDFPSSQNNLETFLTSIEECTINKEYTVYFKDVDYLNNGIVDIPKLNIYLYSKVLSRDYNNINEEITNNNDKYKIGFIDITNELNEKFDQLVSIMDEIVSSFSEYVFKNNKNKELNLFSITNGIYNANNKKLYSDDIDIDNNGEDINTFIKSNGGQSEFIQSNGLIYIDSYYKYCYNSYNLPFYSNDSDDELFQCNNHTTSDDNSFDDTPNDNFCTSINEDLYTTDIYYETTMNNITVNDDNEVEDINTSTSVDFTNELGESHIFQICATYDDYDSSSVKSYLEEILNNEDSDNILDKAFFNLFYFTKNIYNSTTGLYETTTKSYDINNWTDINENKVFSLNKGENGYVISIKNNKDFILNRINIPLSLYKNPFFPDEEFNFFINNSGYDIIDKVLGDDRFETSILKTGSYIEFAIPVVPDIATSNENEDNPFGNHIFMKLIEGSVIY